MNCAREDSAGRNGSPAVSRRAEHRSAGAPVVFGCRTGDAVRHRRVRIVFVENQSGNGSDGAFGYQFADEHDAALFSAPDIETKIHLLKSLMEGHGETAEVRA